jgi:hypothetical protein
MTRPARTRYLRRLPAIGALAGAVGGAIAVTATSPASLADSFALLGVEQVPDHRTLAMIAAVIVGSVCWAIAYLLCGRGGPFEPVRRTPSAPRRIAQHPAPRQRPQWPIAAVDIPAPTPRARPLPVDLDQPLSAFDPNSIPAVSFESIRRSGLRPER